MEKLPPFQVQVMQKTRLHFWFIRICFVILIWACLANIVVVVKLWHPRLLSGFSVLARITGPVEGSLNDSSRDHLIIRPRNYTSNGFLKVSCNGGLNQMRSAICDMVAIARLLNLTLVVPELDKKTFWADHSNFEDVFDVDHFINSLRDEVQIVKKLPKRFSLEDSHQIHEMPPVSWSDENYYLQKILPLFDKYKVIHFNRTDSRLANNGISLDLQRLRCRVNFQALKFRPKIEALGLKLISILQHRGPYLALHLRYEMDMLAFSGCTEGCSEHNAEELKQLRYAFPWWREKEINSSEKRALGLCPLTPEETSLILLALGFEKTTQIYIASGETYGGQRRLALLRSRFPHIVKKEMLLDSEDMGQFRNHSFQMAALDFIVSVASDVFIPTYDGNMARVVEGHRRYRGHKPTFRLDRRKLVQLLDSYKNGTLSWDEFSSLVKIAHERRKGQPSVRHAIANKPKEEDYFYANPLECLPQEDASEGSKEPKNPLMMT